MTWFAPLLVALAVAGADLPTTRGMHQLQAEIPGAGKVLYAVSVPEGYNPNTPAPAVRAR